MTVQYPVKGSCTVIFVCEKMSPRYFTGSALLACIK